MKNVVIGLLLIIIALFAWRIYQAKKSLTIIHGPYVTTITSSSGLPTVSFCSSNDLKPLIDLNAGAGNIYGTFSLKNISSNTCNILGNDFVLPSYNTAKVKNIVVAHFGQTQKEDFVLKPSDTVYSQVHYPNGPQCQEQTVPTNVTFSYKISPNESISFPNRDGSTIQTVQTCGSQKENTTIEIWNMSTHPITPQ